MVLFPILLCVIVLFDFVLSVSFQFCLTAFDIITIVVVSRIGEIIRD